MIKKSSIPREGGHELCPDRNYDGVIMSILMIGVLRSIQLIIWIDVMGTKLVKIG